MLNSLNIQFFCRRAHVLFVEGPMSCLQKGPCLVCRRAHVLFVEGPMFCLQKGPCLLWVVCACLRVVVSNTYCVVFLLCFSQSCVAYDADFSGLSIFDCPLGVLQRYLICHVTNQYSDIISVYSASFERYVRCIKMYGLTELISLNTK